jgi:hypothetical protein
MLTTPTAMIVDLRLGPRTATSPIAKSSPGIASITSMHRITRESDFPPQKPAIAPSSSPIDRPIVTAAKPMSRVYLAPYTMRENSSRPWRSTPSQWSSDGPTGRPAFSRSGKKPFGCSGAIAGAKIAVMMKMAMTTPPATAPGFRRSRWKASRHRPVGSASSSIARASTSATDISRTGSAGS